MNQREYRDLSNLAITRCRESFLSVAQLMDSDVAVMATMLAVAQGFIQNAGMGLALMKGVSKEEGIAKALLTVAECIEETQSATKRPKNPGV